MALGPKGPRTQKHRFSLGEPRFSIRRQLGGNSPATRRQRPRERQLDPSGRRTQQEPFARALGKNQEHRGNPILPNLDPYCSNGMALFFHVALFFQLGRRHGALAIDISWLGFGLWNLACRVQRPGFRLCSLGFGVLAIKPQSPAFDQIPWTHQPSNLEA